MPLVADRRGSDRQARWSRAFDSGNHHGKTRADAGPTSLVSRHSGTGEPLHRWSLASGAGPTNTIPATGAVSGTLPRMARAGAGNRIVFATFGSPGDLNPFLAIGSELRNRGYD